MAGLLKISAILLGLFCVMGSGEKEWCDLKCGDVENTMCEYDEDKTSTDECESIANYMTAEIRMDLLRQHNVYRNDLAGGNLENFPEAANMRLLTWDDGLEKSAQRWASQCRFGHDKCRKTPNFETVGQNTLRQGTAYFIFRYSRMLLSTEDDTALPITGWTDEAKLASADRINSYEFSNTTAHFTQVIWAATFKIGCGGITFNTNEWDWESLVCNYGPAGNIISQPIYTVGEPCTACPDGTQCFPDSDYPNLCASQEEIDSITE